MTKILLVEDDRSIVSVLCDFLREEGFSVISASGQSEALRLLESDMPDIVLLDVSLSDGNGGMCLLKTVAAQYLGSQAPSRKRSAFRQAARLKTALERLETAEVYEYTGSLGTDGPREKRMCWSWLDREAGLLLVTLEDA